MQRPDITFRIELFSTLIDELNDWHEACQDDDFEFAEEKFVETLKAVKDMREVLLEALEGYVNDCKVHRIPVDLGYWRIKKQLEESSFSVVRG